VNRPLLVLTLLLSLALPTALSAQRSEESRRVLLEAAGNGSAAAQYSLGAAAEAEGAWDVALNWYRLAAANGYAGAQFRLGLMLESGRGTAPDLAEARRWFGQAAGSNFKPAIDKLASLGPAPNDSPSSTSALPGFSETRDSWYSKVLPGLSTALTVLLLLAAAGGMYWLFGRLQASSRAPRVSTAAKLPRNRR